MYVNSNSNSINNYSSLSNSSSSSTSKAQTADKQLYGFLKKFASDMGDSFFLNSSDIENPLPSTYNGKQILGLYRRKAREELSNKISDLLEKNDIELDTNEKLTFNVDKDCKIQVSGIDDEEKRAKIEAVLNAEENLGFRLQASIQDVRQFNGNYDSMVYKKWYVNRFLKETAGQSLEDLSLVNGELVGANEKLAGIFNSKPEDVGDDLSRYYQAMKLKVIELKAYGDSNIADMAGCIDFQNGSLIDKDVKYGFGPEQFKLWFANL